MTGVIWKGDLNTQIDRHQGWTDMWRHRTTIYKPRRDASGETNPDGPLIFTKLYPPELWEIDFCYFSYRVVLLFFVLFCFFVFCYISLSKLIHLFPLQLSTHTFINRHKCMKKDKLKVYIFYLLWGVTLGIKISTYKWRVHNSVHNSTGN